MDRTIRVSMFSTAAILAAGLVVSFVTSTVVVSRAIDQRTKAQTKARQDITVKGSTRTRPNSTETSGYGMYDTSTIQKDVTAVVTVTFGVEN